MLVERELIGQSETCYIHDGALVSIDGVAVALEARKKVSAKRLHTLQDLQFEQSSLVNSTYLRQNSGTETDKNLSMAAQHMKHNSFIGVGQ